MNDIFEILASLKTTPLILENLIDSIPENILKSRRIPGKWSIHEHACHIVSVQPMIIDRFKLFIREDKPEFIPYIPGKSDSDVDLLEMDLNATLRLFSNHRSGMIELLKKRLPDFWQKQGIHREFIKYTPYILLRHVLMHDHLHMYKIEELWLTTDEYVTK